MKKLLKRLHFNKRTGFLYLASLSLLLAIPFFWLAWEYLPVQILEYRFEHVKTYTKQGIKNFFSDLDADGIGEEVSLRNYREGYYTIEIYKYKGSMLNSFRLHGDNMPRHNQVIAGDYDSDGQSELYSISLSGDSIFLSGHHPFGKQNVFFQPKLLDIARLQTNKFDLNIFEFKMIDVNGDGFKDLFITIQAAYSLYPRRLYVYDILKKKLIKSDSLGYIPQDMLLIDCDKDGKLEFFGTTSAIKNHKKETPILLNDHSAWLVGFDDDLETMLFPPVEFKLQKPFTQSFMLNNDIGILLYDYNNLNDQFLLRYNLKGNLLDSVSLLTKPYNNVLNKFIRGSDRIYLVTNSYEVDTYNSDYSLEEQIEYNLRPLDHKNQVLEKYGLHLFLSQNKILLCDRSLKVRAKLSADIFENPRIQVSVVSVLKPNEALLAFREQNENTSIFLLKKNKLFILRYLIYILYFTVLAAVLLIILGVPLFFLLSRSNIEKKMREYQLQAIQNQLQPHFTFNILSSIGSLIYSEERDKAYLCLNQFADLLRTVLVQGNTSNWTLKQELDFVNTYLQLQNSRFDNKFSIEQIIELDDLNKWKVPKMIMQSYIENAIKHGLAHKKENCTLQIQLKEVEQHIKIKVIDNGIGRHKASKISRAGTGQGMRVWSEFLRSYNQLNQIQFKVEINDLIEKNNESKGTGVTISIPKNYNEQQ